MCIEFLLLWYPDLSPREICISIARISLRRSSENYISPSGKSTLRGNSISLVQSTIIKKMAACRSKKLFFANWRWRHVMTVENILSHQFIDDWLSFHARKQLYCGKQKQNYCNLKVIDMSILPKEKFIILTEDVALLT